jgi:hypothetical protein
MEPEIIMLRIDNPPDELRYLIDANFEYIDFRKGITIGEYLTEGQPGTYLLTTRSRITNGAVHVSRMVNGVLKDRDLSPGLLNRKIIDVRLLTDPQVN